MYILTKSYDFLFSLAACKLYNSTPENRKVHTNTKQTNFHLPKEIIPKTGSFTSFMQLRSQIDKSVLG